MKTQPNAAKGILALLLCTAPVWALRTDPAPEQFIRRSWDLRDGMPQNSVVSLAQTPDGYLWMATFGGLVRFNGNHFEVFTPSRHPALASIRIACLFTDRSGTLWVGMEKSGLAKRTPGGFKSFTAEKWTGMESVYDLHEGRSGALFAGTNAGLYRFAEGLTRHWTSSDGLWSDTVLVVHESADGTLWVGTKHGLNRIDRTGVHRIPLHQTHTTSVTSLIERRDGSLWLGTNRGVCVMQAGSIRTLPFLEGEMIGVLQEDRDGTLWIGTTDFGLFRFQGTRFERDYVDLVLPNLQVSALLRDREETLWVGSNGEGLHQLLQPRVETGGGPGGPLNLPVRAVLPDRAGGYWVATYGRGIARVTPKGVDFPWSGTRMEFFYTQTLWLDEEEVLWVGTMDNGLVRHFGDSFSIAPVFNDGRRQILAIAPSAPGRLWVGTDDGLWECDPLSGPATLLPGTQERSIFFIMPREGELWLGTDEGVLIAGSGGIRPLLPMAERLHDSVRALHTDARGAVWIGTYGDGLHRWKDGRLFSFAPDSGLSDPTVSFIAEDASGRLWLTGNQGIFCAELEQLRAIAEGRRSTAQVRHFTEEDGMTTRECNGGSQPAGALTPEGGLIVPTIRGVAAIPGLGRPAVPAPLPIHIERVLADGKEIPSGPEIVLTVESRQLEIHYAALSFTSPTGLRYQYRLEGLEDQWTDAGTRMTAYYNDLPPGEYQFRVLAQGVDGGRGEAQCAVHRPPRFTQTGWFLALCTTGLLLAVGGMIRLRTAALHAGQRRLTLQVRERTTELEHLHALSAKINEAILPEEVLDHIYQSFRTLIPFDHLLFTTLEEGNRRLRIVFIRDAAGGARPETEEKATIEAGSAAERWAASEATILSDCSEVPPDLHALLRRGEECSAIMVPLRTRRGPLGFLFLGRLGPDAFDAGHLERVNRIAGQISTILEKSRLYEEVMRLSEMKERFFGMAAHDLRHPLGALVLYVSLLEMEEPGGRAEAMETHLPAMKNACASMRRLIDDLLDFQVMEDGRIALHPQTRDPIGLTREFQADLAIQVRQKGMKLVVHLPSSSPLVTLDPLRVRQVLDNLISNAVKYSAPGSEILLSLEVGNKEIRWSVHDSGAGIAGADRLRLFQPFVKGLHRPASGEKSIGLGLALSKRIVEAHSGSIGFEDRPGGGTIFHFTLPAAPCAL